MREMYFLACLCLIVMLGYASGRPRMGSVFVRMRNRQQEYTQQSNLNERSSQLLVHIHESEDMNSLLSVIQKVRKVLLIVSYMQLAFYCEHFRSL